jgi:hypothetical protein
MQLMAGLNRISTLGGPQPMSLQLTDSHPAKGTHTNASAAATPARDMQASNTLRPNNRLRRCTNLQIWRDTPEA